ncbi:unnamed protein product, partial [Linum tenue]
FGCKSNSRHRINREAQRRRLAGGGIICFKRTRAAEGHQPHTRGWRSIEKHRPAVMDWRRLDLRGDGDRQNQRWKVSAWNGFMMHK